METIDDILREMRDFENVAEDGYDQYEAYQMLYCFADRIEAAYNYALVEKYNGVVNEREKEIESLRDENARLKSQLKTCSSINERQDIEYAHLMRALRPVLDIVMDSATSDLSMELAINEAKRIYKEGTTK